MKEVELEITPEGIKVDHKGFKGDECFKALEELLNELQEQGVEVVDKDTRPKGEAYVRVSKRARGERVRH